jgi:hypothetical protein
MKTNHILLLICIAALSLLVTVASAAARGGALMGRPAMARPAMMRSTPHFAPGNMMGTHRFFGDRFHRFDNRRFFNNRFHRFHNHNNTFVFVDTFGFPFFYPFAYPYPYYGYYPGYYGSYGYYGGYNGYGDGTASRVIEVQRRLARAGYYHGRIDGIMGPQTRRAIRAYERDQNISAYGAIDRQLLVTMGLA